MKKKGKEKNDEIKNWHRPLIGAIIVSISRTCSKSSNDPFPTARTTKHIINPYCIKTRGTNPSLINLSMLIKVSKNLVQG